MSPFENERANRSESVRGGTIGAVWVEVEIIAWNSSRRVKSKRKVVC